MFCFCRINLRHLRQFYVSSLVGFLSDIMSLFFDEPRNIYLTRPKFEYDSSSDGKALPFLYIYFHNTFGPSVFIAFDHNIAHILHVKHKYINFALRAEIQREPNVTIICTILNCYY